MLQLCRRSLSTGKVAAQLRGFSVKFPARSWFFPKKSREGLEKTRILGADVIVLDLEDSVAKDEKSRVRDEYIQALDDKVFAGQNVFVRVSDLECNSEVEEDLRALVRPEITGFLLPKVKYAEQIIQIDNLITKIEKQTNVNLLSKTFVPILEGPQSYFNSYPIATSSKRNICLIAGSGDFTADTVCMDHSIAYDAFFGSILIAAKAAGIEAVCGVHDKIDDHAGLERFCLKMKNTGFIGVAALTPKQIPIINNAFSCSHKEKAWIDNVLYQDDSTKANCGLIRPSVQESRQMVGPPHKKLASSLKLRHEIQSSGENSIKSDHTVRGTPLMTKGIASNISLGEVIHTPHEITITESWRNLWESAFLRNKGYFNSLNRCTSLGLAGVPLPFSLIATMGIAFSVSNLSYYARVHLRLKNVFQNRPVYEGDTVRAMFTINSINRKKGGDGNQYCLADSTHWVVNQHNEVVFQAEKLTMFDPSNCKVKETSNSKHSHRLIPSQSIYQQQMLQKTNSSILPITSTTELIPKTLIVHDFVKAMGESEVRMLCNLLNIVNPHHHNLVRYQATDLLIPGPFVMSAAIGCAALDIGEIVYEEIPVCINPNKVNFKDQIGSITYVESCKQLNSLFEEVKLKHIALKNTDMEVLSQKDMPQKLFEAEMMKPSEYEKICAKEFPMLLHKIACIVERRIIRVRPGLVRSCINPKELQFA